MANEFLMLDQPDNTYNSASLQRMDIVTKFLKKLFLFMERSVFKSLWLFSDFPIYIVSLYMNQMCLCYSGILTYKQVYHSTGTDALTICLCFLTFYL